MTARMPTRLCVAVLLRPSQAFVVMMSALLYLGGASSGFVLPTQPGLCRPGRPGTAAAAVSTPTVLHPQAVPTRAAAAPAQMGLFGLGYPELAVIGLVGIVLLGPERLVPMAKDLGSALQPSKHAQLARPDSRRPCFSPCRRSASEAQPARRADPNPNPDRRQGSIGPQGGDRLVRPGHGGGRGWAARTKRPRGSAPARLLRLRRVRLAALGSWALPGRRRPTGRPATASGARASRLQSLRFHRPWPFRWV